MRSRRPNARHVEGLAVLTLLGLLLSAAPLGAQEVVLARDSSGSALAQEAVGICLRAKAASPDERATLLTRGLAVAERAVAAAERDAKAHFAVFCNLGLKLEAEGASLAAVVHIERLRSEIDRALALAPNFIDALAAKGSFLIELPALLGGDDDEGEMLLRRAVELAPEHPAARLELAKALAEKGDEDEARAAAQMVLATADRRASRAELTEARALARALGS